MNKRINRRRFIQRSAGAVAASSMIGLDAQLMKKNDAILTDDFLARIPQMMEWAGVPGLSIGVVKDGAVAFARGFGVKKAGAAEVVDKDTVFAAASLSKPVFAYAVLKLRDEKLIDLDRPLIEYLPAADLPDDQRSKLITARHALSHTTGFQNWRFRKDDKLTFAFSPGEKFSYTGESYFLLQRAVEKITARGFDEYMRGRVLKPLGMERSSYGWTKEYETWLSGGHNSRGQSSQVWSARFGPKMLELAEKWNKPLPSWNYEDVARALPLIDPELPIFPNFMIPNCAGSLHSTAAEYAQFMARLMTKPDLSASSRKEMFAPQVKINSSLSWGLGLGLEMDAGRNFFWHWGDNGNFKAFMMGEPARRFGLVVFTNGSNGQKLWHRIASELLGEDHAAFMFWMV